MKSAVKLYLAIHLHRAHLLVSALLLATPASLFRTLVTSILPKYHNYALKEYKTAHKYIWMEMRHFHQMFLLNVPVEYHFRK